MHIRTDTWHYKLWRLTYYFTGGMKNWGEYRTLPRQVTLCQYVSRMILVPLPILALLLFMVAVIIIFLSVGNAVTILTGSGFFFLGNEEDEEGVTKVVQPFKVGERQVSKRTARVVLFSLYALALGFVAVFYMEIDTAEEIASAGSIVAELFGAVMWLSIIAFTLYHLRHLPLGIYRLVVDWDGWEIFREYAKAKKEGICPIVMFDDTSIAE